MTDEKVGARGALRLLAIASLTVAALALSACDGSSGPDGGSPPPPPPPPPPPEAPYIVADVAYWKDAQSASHHQVMAFDPANPDHELLSDVLVGTDPSVPAYSSVVWSAETRFDAASGVVTTLGQARAFYVNHGRLWGIDLRGGHDHAPRQIGSASNLCNVSAAYPMSRDGQDAWVVANTVLGHNMCGDNIAVRAAGATEGAVAPFPSRSLTTRPIDSVDGLFGGMLATDDDGLVTRVSFADRLAMHWRPLRTDADGTMPAIAMPRFTTDPDHPANGFLGTLGGIFAVTWNDDGMTLGDLVVAATNPGVMAVKDGVLYYGDGQSLHALPFGGSSTVLATMPLDDGNNAFVDLHAGTTTLALGTDDVYDSNGLARQVATLGLAGDALEVVSAGTCCLAYGSVLGGRGDVALVTWGEDVNAQYHDGLARLSAADGGVASIPGASYIVASADRRPNGVADIVATFGCVQAVLTSQTAICAPGAITQVDLVEQTSVTLGALSQPESLGRPFGHGSDLVQGVAATFSVGTADSRGVDIWMVVPGQAGSFKRLSRVGD